MGSEAGMQLVDAHCHLESEVFSGKERELVEEARHIGIVKMLTAAVVREEWERSLDLAARFTEVECALGVHPWFVSGEDLKEITALERARELGAKAVGEIGLDGKISTPGMDLQVQVFEAQLEIARNLDLPVVIHCRGAFEALIRCLKRGGVPVAGGVIHAFSGSIEIAEECMKHGLFFSMGRSLTYRNSKKRERLLHRVYPDRLLLETDSPDMPPIERSDTVNVPSNIVFALRAAAEILGRDQAEVAAVTTGNAMRLFRMTGVEGAG